MALARRTLVGLLEGLGLTATFTGALAVGASLHAQTPAVRRLAKGIAERFTGELFAGKLALGDVDALTVDAHFAAARVRTVEVTAPDGRRVLLARDVSATLDLRRLLASLAATGAPNVELDHVTVGSVDLALEADASGTPTIARAFEPRSAAAVPPSGAPPPRATAAPAAPITHPRVSIADASIGHVWAHGDLVPPSLDADADDVRGSVLVANGGVDVTVDHGRVLVRSPHAPGQRAPITGVVHGELALGPGGPSDRSASLAFDGGCADVAFSAHGRVVGERVEATLDVPRTEPAAIARAFGDAVPIAQPAELHARLDGTLPTITIDARAQVGDSRATLSGSLDLREGHAFELTTKASSIDARAFGASAATDLSGELVASGNLSGGAGPYGRFRMTTAAGSAAGEKIPAATIEGRFDPKELTAFVRAREPGVDLTGEIALDVPTSVASFDLQARSDALREIARLPVRLGGAGTARARGKVDLERGTIRATVDVSTEDLVAEGLSARRFSASGIVDGPLEAPVAKVGVAGVDVRLTSAGAEPLVYASATGRAHLAIAPKPRIIDAELELGEPGAPGSVRAEAGEIAWRRGGVDVRRVEVHGLGQPFALDAHIGAGTWFVKAKGTGLELRRAAAITGIEELALAPADTRATVDVDLRQERGARATGHVDVLVRSEAGFGSGPIAFETHATVMEGRLVGTSKLAVTGFGEVEIAHADLELPSRFDRPSLERITGVAELRGSVDLSQGAALLAGEHVERVSGIGSFEARIERPDARALPHVRTTARTQGLELALTGDPPTTSMVISGVDLLAHAAWDGASEDAEVAVVSWDHHGVLGSAGAKARLPLAEWIGQGRLPSADTLAAMRVGAIADVPRRAIGTLPAFLSPPPLRGRVEARLEVGGSLGRPDVMLSAHTTRLREDRRKLGRAGALAPVDGMLEARWDGERAAITFALDERERRLRAERAARAGRPPPTPGHLRGLVLVTDLRATDLLSGTALRALPWRASAELEAQDVPLAVLSALSSQTRVTGLLRGRARLRDLNGSPSFELNAHVDDFGTGGARVDDLDVTAGGRDASLFARAAITDQATQATVQLASTALRMKGLEASWDDAAATRLDYAVVNGRLALIAPLLRRTISELDGRVDGAGNVTIDKERQLVEGGLAVQNARVYLNILGEEITGLDAAAKFDPNGVFRVADARGKIGGGEFRAAISGQMRGFRLERANATVVATKEGIPISFEGATFAETTGEFRLTATMSEDANTILIGMEVPRAVVTLPTTTQSLQSLDPDPTIAVGVRLRNGKLDTSAARRRRGGSGGGETLAARLDVVLGSDVRLQGRGLDVVLGGRTLVEIAEELRVTGRIDLRGGSIEVHGRRFTVDGGAVTFPEGGDPDNPTIVATAHWDAPDRTRILVDYAGPLKDGHLTLRSEPQLTQNAILSELLFGQADPNMAAVGSSSGQGNASGAATAVGTGFLAADVNRALAEIDPNLDVDTDTLSGNRVRTKIGRSFFDRRLKVTLGIAPGRGTFRDPDTTYVFFNWHFLPKWSIVATGGDAGTTILDVLYQLRY